MRTPEPTPLSFARGVDNRNHVTALADGHVRAADNVDIDARGVGRTREGYTRVTALAGAHSLWTDELLTFALVADATTLYRLDTDGTLTSLLTGLNGGALSYAVVAGKVRWSNGVQTGQVALDGEVQPLGVSTPLPSYGAQAVANGGLAAGRYGVTMTFADARREEGGAPETVYVDVPEGGGITVLDVPTDPDGRATEARIYATGANGVDLQYVASAAPGAASVLIGAHAPGRLLTTQFCEPFPAATCLLARDGRLMGALDRDLVWSLPLYYGLTRPSQMSLRLPDTIVMLAAPDVDGFLLYVGTRRKTYVLRGDSIETCTLKAANAAGVVPGSMTMIPAEALALDGVLVPTPVWVGTDGMPYAGTEGGVIPLSTHFAYPVYDRAAAIHVERGGLSRYIVAGQGGRASALAMSDYAEAEVIDAGP